MTTALPTGPRSGVTSEMVTPRTVSSTTFDGPPPGAGLITITSLAPTVATSDAGTWTSSRVLVCAVGISNEPPMLTCDAATKPDPNTDIGVPAIPAPTESGEM